MTLRIGNGAGFLGDQLDAPQQLVKLAQLDYLTLEYLAELTMSILAHQKQKDPATGYARDLLYVLSTLLPAVQAQPELKIITNAGGVNPRACARDAAKLFREFGLKDFQIAIVEGDDLLHRIDALQARGHALLHLDTGQPFRELGKRAVAVNAYLGAAPICEALERRARLVITGRVADASLTLAPAIHHYRWNWDDWTRLAAGTVAGHLIECGAQVTGGYSQRWQDLRLGDVGYPIAEIDSDGSTIITKPQGTGGRVDRQSVVEQLVYEIGDPRCYKTPDVDVDFTTIRVEDLGQDRVRVDGASGQRPGEQYKVSLAYHDGYMASAQLLVAGRDCRAKADHCAAIVQERIIRAGFAGAQIHAEFLGLGGNVPGFSASSEPSELVLRMTMRHENRNAVERFTREVAPLITSGPAGLAGYAASRSSVRPVFSYWPTLIPKSEVPANVEVKSAQEWLT